MATTEVLDFCVRRGDLRDTQWQLRHEPELAEGEALLRIERHAFTANNITYAVFGEAMAYWSFFPAADGWGRIPVWGYAEVIASRSADLAPGERVYGYLPMSSHLRLQPARAGESHFSDASAHRASLPAAYQRYQRLGRTPPASPDAEDAQALLWPLYLTAFLIADFLADQQLFGGRQVLLSSASSKTALGLAFLLRSQRPQGCQVLGLTSAGNQAFCESTGYYDRVLAYDQLSGLDPATPTVFVDMAGNGRLLHDVHHHFGAQLRYSCMVGGTHWEQRETQHGLPGAKPAFFFAPTQIRKRQQDWGPGGIEQRFGSAWAALRPTLASWLRIETVQGRAGIEQAYREVLEGRTRPEQGLILSW